MKTEMMTDLVNMKLDPKKQAEKYAPTAATGDAPLYPWGLSITLDDEALEKLGIELPKVGTPLMLCARVDVTAVSSNESTDGKNRSCSLQITDLSLEPEPMKKSAAEGLYGGKG